MDAEARKYYRKQDTPSQAIAILGFYLANVQPVDDADVARKGLEKIIHASKTLLDPRGAEPQWLDCEKPCQCAGSVPKVQNTVMKFKIPIEKINKISSVHI